MAAGPVGVFGSVAAALALLDRRERVKAALLVLSMLLNAGLNLASLGAVLPFVQLMFEPNPLSSRGFVGRVIAFFAITDLLAAFTIFGLGLVAAVVVKNAYGLLHAYLVNRFCSDIETRLASRLLAGVVDAPFEWLARQNTSILRDIIIGYVVDWSRNVMRIALQLTTDLIFLALAVLLLLYASPVVGTLVSAAAIALAIGMVALVQPRVQAAADDKRLNNRLVNVTATEAIGGGRDVRMTRIGKLLVSMFAREFRGYSRADVRARSWQIVPRLGIEIVGFSALVGASLGCLWAGYSRVEIGTLLALYAVVALRAIPAVSQVATGFVTLRGAMPSVAEVRGLSAMLPPARPELVGQPIPADWKEVRLEKVGFTYSNSDCPALADIDLSIKRGRSYGIIGVSGAGKSTFVDVVVGLLRATSGTIRIDGEPFDPTAAAAWRDRISYVAQTPFLLDATIADNIVFGLSDTEPARLAAAIRRAGLSTFIASLPEGANTPVGDRGVRLSGGQRQRIAIARALYRSADFLVLDEATSALDSLTEREIQQAIDQLAGEVTLLIIAHRLSTVTNCDEIVLLDKGRIVERGSHEELLWGSPTYRQLLRTQSPQFVAAPPVVVDESGRATL